MQPMSGGDADQTQTLADSDSDSDTRLSLTGLRRALQLVIFDIRAL